MVLVGPLRIQGEVELLVLVESVAGAAQFVFASAGTVAGDVCHVGSDLVGDQAVAHVFEDLAGPGAP